MIYKTFKLTFLLLFISSFATAQSIEVGAYLGGINSFNDLNTNTSFATIRPAGGILGKYNFDERISAELMIGYGTAFSKDEAYEIDKFQENRNAASKTRTVDIQAAGEFNFFKFGGSRDMQYTPYLSAGVGVTNMRPLVYSRFADNENGGYVTATSVNAEEDEDIPQLVINVPIAGGVKYNLNKKFNLAAEFGSRILFTDYYDGYSTQFTQVGIDSNPGTLNTVNMQRGDRSRNDSYSLLTLQMTYKIPLGRKCW